MFISKQLALRTGLKKSECDILVRLVFFEISTALRNKGFLNIKDLGSFDRVAESSRKISFTMSPELFRYVAKLNRSSKRKKHEIDIE